MQRRTEFNSGNVIMGVIVMVGIFIALFWLAKSIFWILSYLAPVFLIITLILNYKIVVNYLKMLWNNLKTKPLYGVLLTALSVIGFPIVAFLLFGKALLDRKVKNIEKHMEEKVEGEYVDYEIVEEKKLDLPPLEKVEKTKEDDTYDKFFE